MVFEPFRSEIGYKDFGHFLLKNAMFCTLAGNWSSCCFDETIFFIKVGEISFASEMFTQIIEDIPR